ncbi:MAG TPA: hypothetical protein VLB45_05960 [Nitrosopumilaceae archaeon]|nr:hypothetical protein [Nitrosopumilaceae archaeon]
MKKLVIAILFLLISSSTLPVFAQHHENPPASLGNRIAVMDFVFPENIAINEDFTLTMILYDETNKKNFEQVSIQLAIYKEGMGKSLMNELFYDKNGEITIDFKHKDFDQPNKREIKAAVEPILGGWMKDYGSNIQILQNIFSENALYTLKATIVTIDHTRTFISEPITFTTEIHLGGHGEVSHTEIDIPDWVRNNAKWWSNGEIDDKTFANGIQYMIKEGIIKIPTTENEQANNEVKIPDWVRNNAKWWSNGEIDDKTFANGIQYLVKIGVIRT